MDAEAVPSSTNRRGKWFTFPFTVGAFSCLTLACGGWLANLIVYLIEQFSVKSIEATQIFNLVNSGMCFFPVIGAILADSFLGSFAVVTISCCFAFLGTLVITLTSLVDSLRPKTCQTGSSTCQSPSKFQYTLLYVALIMCSIGFGVSRFTLSTFGANQFDEPEDQDRFFDWFFFTMYLFYIVSFAGVVYIQDNVSWGVGYGICLGASFIGLLIFLLANKIYRHHKPQGSPFTSIARVVVASIRKMKMPNKVQPNLHPKLTNAFRFINKAAIEAEGDLNPDGSIAKPWRLCTIQQVEDLKKLIRILPMCSTGILVTLQPVVQNSLTVLQALATDRHLGHFKFPAGSILVLSFISTSVSLSFIDRFFPFLWKKVMGKSPTPLKRIGIGHVVIALSMALSATAERRRLWMRKHGQEMSIIWLFPQMILIGIGEGFYFPAQVAFNYQEFPVSLRSTATSMSSFIIGISFYLGTALVDIVQARTNWLPNNINDGRVDNVFWVLMCLGAINFGYFMYCAKLKVHTRS